MSDKELSGAELDRAIAERVMRWHEQTDYDYQPPQVNWVDEQNGFQEIVNCPDQLIGLPVWSPSESIKAAMQVVERFKDANVVLALLPNENRWRVSITPIDFGPDRPCGCKNPRAVYYSKSLPFAICRAALAAIGSKDE